jgi:hypothetical protein
LRENDWLAVVGAADRTRLQLTVEGDERGGRFMISDEQFVNELTAGQPGSRRTGDGTVPFAGACPPFLPSEALVCVTQKDLAFFEIRDQRLNSFVGLHAILPLINPVHRLAIRHLFPGFRGKISGRHPPGVEMWDPPIVQLENRG